MDEVCERKEGGEEREEEKGKRKGSFAEVSARGHAVAKDGPDWFCCMNVVKGRFPLPEFTARVHGPS